MGERTKGLRKARGKETEKNENVLCHGPTPHEDVIIIYGKHGLITNLLFTTVYFYSTKGPFSAISGAQ